LTVATNGDGYKEEQHNGTSQSRQDLKLTVVNIAAKDSVECQLETAKHSSVSFKFSPFTDQPNDLAASLVSQIIRVIQLKIFTPNQAVASHTAI